MKKVIDVQDKDLAVVFLLLVSGVYILLNDITAFEWPTQDIMPFLERKNDASFLKNDFFTNASYDLNPRYFYGSCILLISKFFNVPWYSVLYFFKLFFLILFLPLVYVGLKNIILVLSGKKYLNFFSQSLLALGSAILLLQNKFLNFLSIAWWQPIVFMPIPTSFSFFFFLLILCILEKDRLVLVRFVLWIFTVLFHPAVSLFLFAFYFTILGFKQYVRQESLEKRVKYWLGDFIGMASGIAIVLLFYIEKNFSVSAKNFIETYIYLAHSSHYDIYHFGSRSKYNWWESAGIISLCFLFLSLVLKRVAGFRMCLFPLMFASMLWIAIFCQWFFIDIIPIKFFAMLGPVRYSFLSYYQILLCLVLTFVHIDLFLLQIKFNKFLSKILQGLIVLSILFFGMKKIDNPKKRVWESNVAFYTWLQTTPSDAVFILPHTDLMVNVGLVGNRSVFFGNGFPFSEKYFREYRNRFVALYGNRKELAKESGWVGARKQSVYNSRTMEYFLDLSEKFNFDYVVRLSHAPFDNKYSSLIVYKGKKYISYKVDKKNLIHE